MAKNPNKETGHTGPGLDQVENIDSVSNLHDIIVIGTSAGGVEALQNLVKDLPPDLGATVFIVIHTSSESPGFLPQILSKAGPLPVSYPTDGLVFEKNHIYVAPTNHHMVLEENTVRVVRGPKENRHRPAIDPLFHSAARNFGPRVIGVLLTGMLDDGVFGLMAIKQRGGLAGIQTPADALYPEMPMNALRKVNNIDFAVPLSEMSALLYGLVREPADAGMSEMEAARAITRQLKIEDEFALSHIPDDEILNTIGKPATIACPECHGTLWEIDNEGVVRYRCRVGHSYTAQSLLDEHSDALEEALWAALRALEESGSLHRRLAS